MKQDRGNKLARWNEIIWLMTLGIGSGPVTLILNQLIGLPYQLAFALSAFIVLIIGVAFIPENFDDHRNQRIQS